MKLYPHERNNNSSQLGMLPIVTPVELNDGIYLHNVRHDKVTLTPYFNSYTPLKGSGYTEQPNTAYVGGQRIDLPFACNASFSNHSSYMGQTTDGHTYEGSWACDHEHFCKGEARKIGHTGYSFINSENKEFYAGLPFQWANYYIRKDKDSHLDFDIWPTGGGYMTNTTYYINTDGLWFYDENLHKANPNLIFACNGGYYNKYRGAQRFGALGNSTNVTSQYIAGLAYQNSYNYNVANHRAYLAPQFLARSADYIFCGFSHYYYSSSGLSYYEIYRYNKGTNTETTMYNGANYNRAWVPTFSNSITDDNNSSIEHVYHIVATSDSSNAPNWTVGYHSINKSTGACTNGTVTSFPTGTNYTHWPQQSPYNTSSGVGQRSNCFVSEIGTSGEDVASGAVEVGRDYRVVDDSVTYNSVAKDVGDIVTGASGVTTYTGSGKLQTVTKKFLTHIPTGTEDYANSSVQSYKMLTMKIVNEDISATMYRTSHTTPTDYHVQPEATDTRIKTFCALDPYYNRIIMLTNQTATIMEVSSAGTWSTVKQFQGNFQSAGMDSTGRLFLAEENSPYELHMYTTDLPYQVSIIPNKTNYTYTGTTINTHLSAEATNFEDAKVQTILKLNIHGSAAQFTDGTQTKTITTSTTVPIKIDFNVVAGGYFKIDAEATSN